MTKNFLYNNIENPLNKAGIIDQIIEAYSKPSFSKAILRTNSSSSEVISDEKEIDKLYAKLFNTWKENILTLKPEQINDAIARGIYDKSIYKLQDLLKVTPDATTLKDVNKVFTKDYKDSELVKAISQYRWDNNSTFTETIINARNVYAKKFPSPNTEHELYINCANDDLHKIANIFIDKCTEMNLPYSFKISERDNCDNKITIYSDSKRLRQYIDILNKIEKEHPEIIKRCGEPPIISGQITNWLGYGKTSVTKDGKLEYLPKRIKIIEKSIDEELRSWYKENKDLMLTINSKDRKTITLNEYLSTQIYIDTLTKMQNWLDQSSMGKQFNMVDYGYTEETLSSQEFRTKLYSIITKETKKYIEDYSNGRSLKNDIVIPVNNEKTYMISDYQIIAQIRNSIKMISSVDSNFTRKVKDRIIENSKKAGIDPKNYCFDQNKQKNTPNAKAMAIQEQENIKTLSKEFGCQYPRDIKEGETAEQYSMYLKLYCTKILKPEMDSKKQRTTPVPQKEEPQQTKTAVKAQKGYKYKAMTPEEISTSQAKLGFAISDVKAEEPKENKAQGKHSNNSAQYVYIPMTDEDIIASRQKIGEYIPPKQKIK